MHYTKVPSALLTVDVFSDVVDMCQPVDEDEKATSSEEHDEIGWDQIDEEEMNFVCMLLSYGDDKNSIEIYLANKSFVHGCTFDTGKMRQLCGGPTVRKALIRYHSKESN